MRTLNPTWRQRGVTTVEFAIVGVWFFMVLFAVIEFGRVIFTYNMLQEGVRRAARVAVVCPALDPLVAAKATFASLPNLDTGQVTVQYLDRNGGDASGNYGAIEYVRVAITGYQMELAIPLVNPTIGAPDFSSTLPRESLGVPKHGEAGVCD